MFKGFAMSIHTQILYLQLFSVSCDTGISGSLWLGASRLMHAAWRHFTADQVVYACCTQVL